MEHNEYEEYLLCKSPCNHKLSMDKKEDSLKIFFHDVVFSNAKGKEMVKEYLETIEYISPNIAKNRIRYSCLVDVDKLRKIWKERKIYPGNFFKKIMDKKITNNNKVRFNVQFYDSGMMHVYIFERDPSDESIKKMFLDNDKNPFLEKSKKVAKKIVISNIIEI